jgi:hypothetical protein
VAFDEPVAESRSDERSAVVVGDDEVARRFCADAFDAIVAGVEQPVGKGVAKSAIAPAFVGCEERKLRVHRR